MNERRTPSTRVSADTIAYLLHQGHTQAWIAKVLHVSEGFVSLVKNRKRALTIDHLDLIASALSLPLGAMMIAATTPKKLSRKNKPFFDGTARIIRMCDDLRAALLKDPKALRRRTA